VSGQPCVFLVSDTQLKSEAFLEDINNILNTGAWPGRPVPRLCHSLWHALLGPRAGLCRRCRRFGRPAANMRRLGRRGIEHG
jgi:hypothetical protein